MSHFRTWVLGLLSLDLDWFSRRDDEMGLDLGFSKLFMMRIALDFEIVNTWLRNC